MLSQIIAVTGVNIRSIRERLGSSTVAVIGIAGVVLVFVAVLSIAEGVKATMEASGDPNTVMILRAGSDTEMTSGLAGDAVRVIQDAPGHRARQLGHAADVAGAVRRRRSPAQAIGHARPTCRCAASRRRRSRCTRTSRSSKGATFEFGKNEIIAGRAAARQFVDLTVGTTLKWGESTWQLVGIFEDGGRGLGVRAVVRREGAAAGLPPRQQLPVGLRAAGLARFVPAVEGLADDQPAADGVGHAGERLLRAADADAAGDHPHHRRHHRHPDGRRARCSAPSSRCTRAVASRTREIATLRALGFGSVPVVISVLVEAALLSIVGGVIGGAIAWLAFDGYETATMNFQSFSQIAFQFAVTPATAADRAVLRAHHGPGRRPPAGVPRRPSAGRHGAARTLVTAGVGCRVLTLIRSRIET